MATQTIELTLDMIPATNTLPICHISQSDLTWRQLKFTLQAGGVSFTIPSGAIALVNGKKADGTGFSYQGTVDTTNSTVTIDVQAQMSAYPGPVIMEVVLENGTEVLGSSNFLMMVEPSPLNDATLSDSDLNAIAYAVQNVAAAIQAAQTATEKAAEALQSANDADDAKDAAVNAKNDAVSAKDTAISARDAAISAKNTAVDAKDTAVSARDTAVGARNEAAGYASTASGYKDQAKDYRDQAAGYAGDAAFSFMVDSDGFISLHFKEDAE